MAQQQIAMISKDKNADVISALADADLKQAQTVKTLVESAILPSQQLMQQATQPEFING
jgi:hypothetical protein